MGAAERRGASVAVIGVRALGLAAVMAASAVGAGPHLDGGDLADLNTA